ncbi:reverse transcriptase family protein, partial [bacterium]|nr:reverse transcriptase family protein [bacterium]
LNTSYRLFAKTLGDRLGPCLNEVISPEQTAFLQGRNMGDSIMLLQGLPRLLCRDMKQALAVFCDFEKASDTIDRKFLFRIMECLGFGDAFLNIVQIILPEQTYSKASVNGFASKPEPFYAGVRQGCPLAPLLYLFIAEALFRFLKSEGLGITVRGRAFTASQYADDTEVFLPDAQAVVKFLATMHIFEKASGQRLNTTKTKVLLLGHARPTPPTIEGLTVVSEVKTLGVTFKAFTGDPTPDWEFQVTRIKSAYSSISRWTLTAFGRAYASGTYAVSRVLHHAEYSGAPPAGTLQELEKITAKLVARGQAPEDPKPKFAGVHHKLLLGSPSEGGFGAFPWAQHIKARHALIAIRAITGDIANPWVFIAHQHLRDAGFSPLSAIWNTHRAPRLVGGHLGHCLQMLQDLQHPTVISQLLPGAWCADMPLWGRIPHLSPSPGTYLEAAVSTPDLPLSGLETIGDVIAALDKITASNYTNTNLSDYIPSVYMRFFDQQTPLMQRTLVTLVLPESARTHLEHLIQQLPADWVQAARQTLLERAAAGELYAPASLATSAMEIAATARAATIHRAAPAMQIASLCTTATHLFSLAASRESRIRESCQVVLKSVGWPRWRGSPFLFSSTTVKWTTRMILRQETAADYTLSETQRLAWAEQQQQQQHTQQDHLHLQDDDSQDPLPGPSASTATPHRRLQPTRRYKYIDFVADATGSDECKHSQILANI